MKALILFLTTSSFCPAPSHGAGSTMRCLIHPKSVKVTVKQSAAVFSGEVLEIRNDGNYLAARFRVERSWKGVAAEEVSVITVDTAESPHYRIGEKYLVFAGIRDGKWFTGNCSRTKRLESAQEDLQQLGEGKGGGKESSPTERR